MRLLSPKPLACCMVSIQLSSVVGPKINILTNDLYINICCVDFISSFI